MRPAISDDQGRFDLALDALWAEAHGGLSPKSAMRLAAECEAQRILRQTEPVLYADGYGPDQYRGASDMRVTVLGRDYARFGVAHAVLAEALERFIEA